MLLVVVQIHLQKLIVNQLKKKTIKFCIHKFQDKLALCLALWSVANIKNRRPVFMIHLKWSASTFSRKHKNQFFRQIKKFFVSKNIFFAFLVIFLGNYKKPLGRNFIFWVGKVSVPVDWLSQTSVKIFAFQENCFCKNNKLL